MTNKAIASRGKTDAKLTLKAKAFIQLLNRHQECRIKFIASKPSTKLKCLIKFGIRLQIQ